MNKNYYSNDIILLVWQKGITVPGYKPEEYRKDEAGAWISFADYGNTNSIYGWEIDHIIPQSRGGGDNLSNLQPLQHENNRAKGDNYPTYNAAVTSHGNKNVHYSRT